jgi:hypothetical protein
VFTFEKICYNAIVGQCPYIEDLPVADLSVEQFDQVPDFLKGDFEQVGEVYRHKTEGKVSTLKASLDGLDAKLKAQQTAEEQKLKDAEAKAFEKLKKEGKADEIIADYEKRLGETTKQYEERINKMIDSAKRDKRSSIVSELASELAIPEGKKAFAKLVENRIDYDPETGKTIFLNEDGSASSLDLTGFKAEISKSEVFAPVIKATVNTGGLAKGNNQDKGSARKTISRHEFEAMDANERSTFFKDGGKLKE